METHEYRVNLDWDKGRTGTLSSPELKSSIMVATPPQFSGGLPDIWSPEHLFTASVVSCFMTTFLAIAENSKFEFLNFQCNAMGVLSNKEGKYAMTSIFLHAQLTIKDQSLWEKAKRLLEKSEKLCLISQSIHTEVTLDIEIIFSA
ncbi:MAG: OsmC family protein [Saprospiraceae bacterium]|nr:OsmC family protein [Saprospiraceae bacterium]